MALTTDNPERYKVGDETIAAAKDKVYILQTQDLDETCATFVLTNEDHTLGNSLRWMLLKDPAVDFCGYSAPHPSEKKIHVRLQTREGHKATDVLLRALDNLDDISDHISATFEASIDAMQKKAGAAPMSE